VAIYDRHRQHVWTDHSIGQAEAALERAGLFRRVDRIPAICFVDLTGCTRLTEERGDEAAARLATSLATLVEDISAGRIRRGPIRANRTVDLKGVARAVTLYRAFRADSAGA